MIQRIKQFFSRTQDPVAELDVEQHARYEYSGELREKAIQYMCHVFDNPQTLHEPSPHAMGFAMSIITGTRVPIETLIEKRTIPLKE